MQNVHLQEASRKAAVKGTFYPESCHQIRKTIKTFNKKFDAQQIPKELEHIKPQALIVPHAGYIYSGFTANFAYRFLTQSTFKRIIVIGPSHRHYFEGISGSFYENFETPCTNITIDSPYLFALSQQCNIGFEPKAHVKEHSTEVQMPFIDHYFKGTKVIELVYGQIATHTLANIITVLLQNKDNAVIISSDLSHFYTLEEAKKLDKQCLHGMQNLDESRLHKGCEACGFSGIEAMILAAKKQKLTSKLLDYRTSENTSQDSRSVVGYVSAMFY